MLVNPKDGEVSAKSGNWRFGDNMGLPGLVVVSRGISMVEGAVAIDNRALALLVSPNISMIFPKVQNWRSVVRNYDGF